MILLAFAAYWLFFIYHHATKPKRIKATPENVVKLADWRFSK